MKMMDGSDAVVASEGPVPLAAMKSSSLLVREAAAMEAQDQPGQEIHMNGVPRREEEEDELEPSGTSHGFVIKTITVPQQCISDVDDDASSREAGSNDEDSLLVAGRADARAETDAPPLSFITIHQDFDDYSVDYENRQFEVVEKSDDELDNNDEKKTDSLMLMMGPDAPTATNTSDEAAPPKKKKRVVHFESVQVREYNITIGDHPFCSKGAPITLDWEFSEGATLPLELYESSKKRSSRRRRRSRSRMLMDPIQRRDLLWRFGHHLDEIEVAAKENEKEKFRQSINLYMLPLYVLQEFFASQKDHFYNKKKRKKSREAEMKNNEAQVRQLHRMQFIGRQLHFIEDPEQQPCNCHHHHHEHYYDSIPPQQHHQDHHLVVPAASSDDNHSNKPRRRISLRGSNRSADGASPSPCMAASSGSCAANTNGSGSCGGVGSGTAVAVAPSASSIRSSASSNNSHPNNNNNNTLTHSITSSNVTCSNNDHSSSLFLPSSPDDWSRSVMSERESIAGSEASGLSTASSVVGSRYKIQTDPRQHDKATEIILCSIERPHMRAFHASWFGFFIGFVMWFAITPLLGEVKESLDLTNSEIWTSSLCGTAVTIVARVIMGPLCDVFGARKCMAAIVIVSAIPCGLTGLCNTATGLSAVRAFVGIAGSAFVPCQYWTSRMFAREVAGTANALVAGWGNLGGGITQLLMGAGLFPLFVLIYQLDDDRDDARARELAWRTVFVIPSIIAFMAAYVYIYHCEDSPKGDYAELVRQQQIEMVSPFWSLGLAIQNRNVILLLVQYACCFGVEITMTNAIALYMREEFAQSTISAAAIASVFGMMNLFARGLGGYGSDYCQSKYGTKGRVWWQSFTLFMEGMGIVVFAYQKNLVGAILSLIFLSLWVQCAEGSTYGIVPYVNRRFTGAVVGWIGAGGTLGGVIFSVFFREFESNQKAFLAMGLTAAGSAFLSIFMNMKSLAAIYQEKIQAEYIKTNNNFVFHDDAPAPPRTSNHHNSNNQAQDKKD
ncbi:affinity nitrate transporter 2 [Seminavis robusta]|uniref:Affinity nitrate transporter 2 n=1 Tax=Seminavis robusta TaxID=568900 RepID=A0A9N8H4A4_9STRA|nr:affinity nitrate transporter 2 [Seminavis robusta]|eukprot:Sro109_g054430.1 affinity nitrate transporter 2 (1009) ;mRNA; r:16917-20421